MKKNINANTHVYLIDAPSFIDDGVDAPQTFRKGIRIRLS